MPNPITITWPETYPDGHSAKHTTKAARVYLKQFWGSAWVEEEHLQPLVVRWRAAPAMPVATLGSRRYGRGILPETTWWQLVQRLSKNRWFVKIEFDVHDLTVMQAPPDDLDTPEDESETPLPVETPETLDWYGTLEVDADQLLGHRQTPDGSVAYEAGEQVFSCYGLEFLLRDRRITSHAWRHHDTGVVSTVECAPDFNADARGNRAAADSFTSYVFSDKVTEPDEDWTTKEIVRYLIWHQGPVTAVGYHTLPIDLEDPDAQLPDWDTPVVHQAGRTVHGVLSELITASRLTGWWLDVEASTDPLAADAVLFRPFTYTGEEISLHTGYSDTMDDRIPENARRLVLDFSSDPDARCTIHTDSGQQVDQVIYRGARRASVCSLSWYNDCMEEGWPAALQTEYNAGGSGGANYPAVTEVSERQRADAEARSNDRLRAVYTRFRIPDDWSGFAQAGFYGGGQQWPVFPRDDDNTQPYDINPRELRVLPTTPLLEGHDYESYSAGNVTPYTEGPWTNEPPVVFAPMPVDDSQDPVDSRWVQLDRNAAGAGVEVVEDEESRTWSATVDVPENDRAVMLRVHGAPQHAIAFDNFTAQAHETELKWGEYDYEEFVFLIGLEDQRYCESRYPEDEDLDKTLSFIRRHVVDAGEDYRLDYLVPNTFIRCDPETRLPVLSDGGFIRDNRFQLAAMARSAWEYLGTERKSITIETRRVNSAIRLGDLITQIGGTHTHEINSVVTSIEVTVDQADGPTAGPTVIKYETAFVDRHALDLG